MLLVLMPVVMVVLRSDREKVLNILDPTMRDKDISSYVMAFHSVPMMIMSL